MQHKNHTPISLRFGNRQLKTKIDHCYLQKQMLLKDDCTKRVCAKKHLTSQFYRVRLKYEQLTESEITSMAEKSHL